MELLDIDNILNSKFKPKEQSILSDIKVGLKHKVDNKAFEHRLYKFDDDEGKVFPYWGTIKGLRQMCDYFLFAQKDDSLYMILIELKDGKQSGGAEAQLRAGESFLKYIIDSAKRIGYDTNNAHTIKVTFRPGKGASNTRPSIHNGIVIYKFNTFCINHVINIYNTLK